LYLPGLERRSVNASPEFLSALDAGVQMERFASRIALPARDDN